MGVSPASQAGLKTIKGEESIQQLLDDLDTTRENSTSNKRRSILLQKKLLELTVKKR